MIPRTVPTKLIALACVAALAGCEYSGDHLFNEPIEGVPGVLDLKSESGGALVPAVITSPEEAAASTIYAEIGPNTDALPSGVTFEFLGIGDDVCVFFDPELVWWNQSVSQQAPERDFRFPDNPYDDGDLDMRVGLSVYYRGTPGVEMGGFEVQYTDDLGNDVEVNLVSCQNSDSSGINPDAHAGRGAPDFCTVRNTQPGVSYTVALEAFSLPRDDARLGFGVLLAAGRCDGGAGSLISTVAPADPGETRDVNFECVIRGEAIYPEGDGKILYGYEDGHPSWPGSEDFEDHYCTEPINTFCNQEARRMREAGLTCDYTGQDVDENGVRDDARRCYCGDINETPNPGARR